MTNQEKLPFGEDWKKEVSKFKKDELINWLSNSLKESLVLKDQRRQLISMLQSLVLSMSAHPDYTPGSEFDDLTSLAQELINEIKTTTLSKNYE